MSDSGIHVNDVGTLFKVTVWDGTASPLNISTATVKQLRFLMPTGASFMRSASFITDGSDGGLKYISVTGDLPTPGDWIVQPYIEIPSACWHGSQTSFEVYSNIGS